MDDKDLYAKVIYILTEHIDYYTIGDRVYIEGIGEAAVEIVKLIKEKS